MSSLKPIFFVMSSSSAMLKESSHCAMCYNGKCPKSGPGPVWVRGTMGSRVWFLPYAVFANNALFDLVLW